MKGMRAAGQVERAETRRPSGDYLTASTQTWPSSHATQQVARPHRLTRPGP